FGQKIEWMRSNPKVCVEVEEIARQSEWMSVIANGLYQELSEPQYTAEREHASQLLGKRHSWWQNHIEARQSRSGYQLFTPLFISSISSWVSVSLTWACPLVLPFA